MLGLQLDSIILTVFSNLNDSMILYSTFLLCCFFSSSFLIFPCCKSKKALKFAVSFKSLRISPFTLEFLLKMELMHRY